MADYSDILRKLEAVLPERLAELDHARKGLRSIWADIGKVQRQQAQIRETLDRMERSSNQPRQTYH